VPDIQVDGAFDDALKDVVFVEHIASPLAIPVSWLRISNMAFWLTCTFV
jgi:hypothetical protein